MEEEKNVEMENESVIPNQNPDINEKKEVVLEEQNIEKVDNKAREPKKDKTNVVVLILLALMAICAILYLFVLKPAYEKDKQDNSNPNTSEQTKEENNSQDIENTEYDDEIDNQSVDDIEDDETESLNSTYDIPILSTDSEEIKIAKQKLNEANSFLKHDSCDDDELYSQESFGNQFCYYNTLDAFKKEFYDIYSSELDYKDVYAEYMIPLSVDNYSTNIKDVDPIQGYIIKDNKVYIDSCSIGSGDYERADNFVLESNLDDTIKVNYKIIYKDQLAAGDEYDGGNGQIILVKENGDWKIQKATIISVCNWAYIIGK